MLESGNETRAGEQTVFISAFTKGDAGAIHAYTLDLKTGKLSLINRTTDVENPFFLAVSPDEKFLYSIHALAFGGKDNEEVAAYKIEPAGKLKFLNRQSAMGTASCYLAIDATGKTALVANYSTGSVASLPTQQDGSLKAAVTFIQHTGSSVDLPRQKQPNAHSIIVSPNNKFVYAADLGIDKILCYQLDAERGKLTPNKQPFVRLPPGSGPRHLTFHPNGKFLYAVNEIKNTVTLFDHDAETGFLIEQQTVSTLPDDFEGRSHTADLKITPDGQFLYATNRGHDSIATYRIGDDGKLKRIAMTPSLGKGPQNLAISDHGEFLICANMPGNSVVVFHINAKTGELQAVGEPTEIPMPSCIMLLSPEK